MKLSSTEVDAVVAKYGFRGSTARAVRLFLTGICKTRYEAAQVAGIDRSVVTRAIQRVMVTTECPTCGHPITKLNI